MTSERPKTEEIAGKLLPIEALIGQGMPRVDAIRLIRVTEQTYFVQVNMHRQAVGELLNAKSSTRSVKL